MSLKVSNVLRMDLSGYHPHSGLDVGIVEKIGDSEQYLAAFLKTQARYTTKMLLLLVDTDAQENLRAVLMEQVEGQPNTVTRYALQVDDNSLPVLPHTPEQIEAFIDIHVWSTGRFAMEGSTLTVLDGIQSTQHFVNILPYRDMAQPANDNQGTFLLPSAFIHNMGLHHGAYVAFCTPRTKDETFYFLHMYQLRTPDDGRTWNVHPVHFVPVQ